MAVKLVHTQTQLSLTPSQQTARKVTKQRLL